MSAYDAKDDNAAAIGWLVEVEVNGAYEPHMHFAANERDDAEDERDDIREGGGRARIVRDILVTPDYALYTDAPCEHCGGVNGYHACDAAERGELGYSVQRRHTGTEDGALYYVALDGELVSGDGHVQRDGASAELADVLKLAALSDFERADIDYMRACCPAPGDYAVAIYMQNGHTGEYRFRAGHDRNVPSTHAERQVLVSGALAGIRGHDGAHVVDVCGDVFTPDADATPDMDAKPDAAMLAGLRATYWHAKRETWASVYDGRVAMLDTDGGRWAVVCERHGAILNVDTLALAHDDARNDPAEYCEDCRDGAKDADAPNMSATDKLAAYSVADAITRIVGVADGIAEVSASPQDKDTAEYVRISSARLSELVAGLTPEDAATLAPSVLDAAGFVRVTGRVVSHTDDIGRTYTHGALAIPAKDAETVAEYAREWAQDCQWRDGSADALETLSATTMLTCAAAHYDGGLGVLISDALYNVARDSSEDVAPGMPRDVAVMLDALTDKLALECGAAVYVDTFARADGAHVVFLTPDAGGAPDHVVAIYRRSDGECASVNSDAEYRVALKRYGVSAIVQRDGTAVYTLAPGGTYARGIVALDDMARAKTGTVYVSGANTWRVMTDAERERYTMTTRERENNAIYGAPGERTPHVCGHDAKTCDDCATCEQCGGRAGNANCMPSKCPSAPSVSATDTFPHGELGTFYCVPLAGAGGYGVDFRTMRAAELYAAGQWDTPYVCQWITTRVRDANGERELQRVRLANPHADATPSTPGAYGADVDAACAKLAIDAARAWRTTGDMSTDVQTCRDIIGDLPSAHIPGFLASIGHRGQYGLSILDALAAG